MSPSAAHVFARVPVKRAPLERGSGIELLRIVLMFLIVVHHLIVHGCRLAYVEDLPYDFATLQKLCYEPFVLFPVDCFVLISGFFGIRLRLGKAVALWLQCSSYALGIALFALYAGHLEPHALALAPFPILSGTWWFFSCYFFLVLLSPFLNTLASRLSRGQFRLLLVIAIALDCVASFPNEKAIFLAGNGSTFLGFCVLYGLGRYLRLHDVDLAPFRWRLLGTFLACCLTVAGLTIASEHFHAGAEVFSIYRFNNPLVLIEAVCVFYLFQGLQWQNRLVNRIAGMVFAVYLLHDHEQVRPWLYQRVLHIDSHSASPWFGAWLFLDAFLVLVAGLLIEEVRRRLLSPLVRALLQSAWFRGLEQRLDSLLQERPEAASMPSGGRSSFPGA